MGTDVKQVVERLIAASPNADVVLISHQIDRPLYYRLSKILAAKKSVKKHAIVFLNTDGGDPHAGYRIARCLRYHYDRVRLVVPHRCKSAGTLVAIGADEVAIGDLGELGPLDVQISKRTEMLERSSGLDYTEALNAMLEHAQSAFRATILDIRAGAGISTKMAGEFASQLAIGMVAPMYGQIDPIQVGEVHRAMKIAYEYGTRLNDESKQLKNGALIELVSGYPDHSFVIDRKEAKKLFKSVKPLTSEEQDLSTTLWDAFFRREADDCHLLDVAEDEPAEDDDAKPADQTPEPSVPDEGDAGGSQAGSTATVDGGAATPAVGSVAGVDAGSDRGQAAADHQAAA